MAHLIPKRLVRLAIPWLVMSCVGSLGVIRAENLDALFDRYNALYNGREFTAAEKVAAQMLKESMDAGWKCASLNCLGRVYFCQDRNTDAEKIYLQALEISLPKDNINRAWVPNNLALVYSDQRKYDQAEKLFRAALKEFQLQEGASSENVAMVLCKQGDLEFDQKRYAQAEDYYLQAYRMQSRLFGPEHETACETLEILADLSLRLGSFDEAETRYKELLAAQEKAVGPSDRSLAATLQAMGALYRQQQRYADAADVDRRALAIHEKAWGPNDPGAFRLLINLATDVKGTGKSDDEAARLNQRANDILSGKAAKKPTRRLEIAVPTASVYDGANVVGEVHKGEKHDVIGTKPSWHGIAFKIQGDSKTGWLRDSDVTLLSEGGAAAAVGAEPVVALAWRNSSPPQAHCTVAFPGSPKLTKQTVGGIGSLVYSCETPRATFTLSYLELPADKLLTLDVAVTACITAMKGTIVEKKRLNINSYPARDVTAQLPDRSTLRMHICTANHRWYQVMVGLPSGQTAGADTDRFVNSLEVKN